MSKALEKLSTLAEQPGIQVRRRKMFQMERIFRRYVFQWNIRIRHGTFADAQRDGELNSLRNDLIASFTMSLDAAIQAEIKDDPATLKAHPS